MIINNRPLTLLYYDNQDTLPNITDNKESNFTKRVQYTKKLLNHFWSRWSYLIELREYRTKRYKNSRNKTITVNDTIIIMDDNRPRASWRFGIVKIIESEDSQVRSVNVVVVSNGRLNIIRRPMNKLIPIEMSVDDEVDEGLDDVDDIGDVQVEMVRDEEVDLVKVS